MEMTLPAQTSERDTSSSLFEEAPLSLFEIVVAVALGQTAVVLAYVMPSFLNRLLGFQF
jgi:hypothetical protein